MELAVARDRFEPPGLPVRLGLLDPVLAAGDEVPPDVPGSIHRLAPQQQEAGRCLCAQGDLIARAEDQELAGVEPVARHLDRPAHHVDGTLLVLGRQGQRRTRREARVGIEHRGEGRHGRALAIERTGDDPHLQAVAAYYRQVVAPVMRESGCHLLGRSRQGHPSLDAEQPAASRARLGRAPLGMGDAPARRHPVDVARPDRLQRAQAVAMQDLALEQVGHGGEPDMRMRTDVQASSQDELRRTHLVEEDERADHLLARRRQGAAYLEPAQIAGARHDHRFDQVGRDLTVAQGVGGRLPAHSTLLAMITDR